MKNLEDRENELNELLGQLMIQALEMQNQVRELSAVIQVMVDREVEKTLNSVCN